MTLKASQKAVFKTKYIETGNVLKLLTNIGSLMSSVENNLWKFAQMETRGQKTIDNFHY